MIRLFADKAARRRIADLEAELLAAARKLSVAEAEIEAMAGVIERDRRRVAAETAIQTRRQAEAEGNDRRTQESISRFES